MLLVVVIPFKPVREIKAGLLAIPIEDTVTKLANPEIEIKELLPLIAISLKAVAPDNPDKVVKTALLLILILLVGIELQEFKPLSEAKAAF